MLVQPPVLLRHFQHALFDEFVHAPRDSPSCRLAPLSKAQPQICQSDPAPFMSKGIENESGPAT